MSGSSLLRTVWQPTVGVTLTHANMTRQVRSEFSGGVHLGQQDDWPKPLKPEVKEQLDSR